MTRIHLLDKTLNKRIDLGWFRFTDPIRALMVARKKHRYIFENLSKRGYSFEFKYAKGRYSIRCGS